MRNKIFKSAFYFSLVAVFCTLLGTAEQTALSGEQASFTDSLKSELQRKTSGIFKKSCATSGCHRGNYPKAKLNLEPDKMLEALIDVPSTMSDSHRLVDTKMPGNSYLVKKIRGDEGTTGNRMPMQSAPLKDEEIAVIRLWIYSLHVLGTDTEKVTGETLKKAPETDRRKSNDDN